MDVWSSGWIPDSSGNSFDAFFLKMKAALAWHRSLILAVKLNDIVGSFMFDPFIPPRRIMN